VPHQLARSDRPFRDEQLSRAMELRRQGWSYDHIADACGYDDAITASRAVNSYCARLKRANKEHAEAVRHIEEQRLESLWHACCKHVEESHFDPHTILAALKVCERKAKLMGLDKPTRVDVGFSMTEREAGNTSDYKLAVTLLQKCAVVNGDDPLAIAREAIAGLPEGTVIQEDAPPHRPGE
jgi:hypothetical protein